MLLAVPSKSFLKYFGIPMITYRSIEKGGRGIKWKETSYPMTNGLNLVAIDASNY